MLLPTRGGCAQRPSAPSSCRSGAPCVCQAPVPCPWYARPGPRGMRTQFTRSVRAHSPHLQLAAATGRGDVTAGIEALAATAGLFPGAPCPRVARACASCYAGLLVGGIGAPSSTAAPRRQRRISWTAHAMPQAAAARMLIARMQQPLAGEGCAREVSSAGGSRAFPAFTPCGARNLAAPCSICPDSARSRAQGRA